ncbi:MAG TPA: PIG-L family deacetylase, partial [Anaerolineae bacterium]|nr:PIG-L family deacetylase [Anaerolineae bacterium]
MPAPSDFAQPLEDFPVLLYLAPHLDDAVLSCGGLIHRQAQAGHDVLVLTVFAGDPPPGPRSGFAALLAQLWEAPEEPMAVRRVEDQAALASLGARWQHWAYPDCIFRSDPESGEFCYPIRDAIFGQVHPAERAALVDELAARLAESCREWQPEAVYSLLTAGHHVDHQ